MTNFIKNTRKNTNDAREGVSEFDEIKLKSVSYKYPNQKGYALKSANFSLRKGEVISILGYNGSGKNYPLESIMWITRRLRRRNYIKTGKLKRPEPRRMYFGYLG